MFDSGMETHEVRLTSRDTFDAGDC